MRNSIMLLSLLLIMTGCVPISMPEGFPVGLILCQDPSLDPVPNAVPVVGMSEGCFVIGAFIDMEACVHFRAFGSMSSCDWSVSGKVTCDVMSDEEEIESGVLKCFL